MKQLKAYALLSLVLALWPGAAVAAGTEAFYQDVIIEDLHSLTVTGDATVDGDAAVGGNLSVTGTSTLTGTVQADGSMSVGKGSAPDASAVLELSSTSKGFLPPKMTTAQRDLIASPATGLVIFNTTTNRHEQYNGSGWAALAGGSGGADLLLTGDSQTFETTVGDWAAFDIAAASTPGANPTGGTPTVTCTRTTTDPYADGALLLTHPGNATSYQGEGCSVGSIDLSKYKGSRIGLRAIMETLSGTYAASEVGWYIWDVANSAAIAPVATTQSDGWLGVAGPLSDPLFFDIPTNATTGTLALYIKGTGTSAYTIAVDNVTLDGQMPGGWSGAVTTKWTSWTPTGSWTANATYTGKWMRVGDTAHFQGKVATGAAPTPAGALTLNLPSGMTIDTSKLAISADSSGVLQGSRVRVNDSGATYHSGDVVYSSTTAVAFRYQTASTATVTLNGGTITDAAPMSFGASDNLEFSFSVPIAEWFGSSSYSMSGVIDIAKISQTRVTGAAPDAIGEYRSYLRDASAWTFTETNGAPGTAPTAADGFRLYGGNTFASADTNNEPTKYEFFVGKNKHVTAQWFASTGRTGFFNASPDTGSIDLGHVLHYDPTTGIATVIAARAGGVGVDHYSGRDAASTPTEDAYFTIIVSENPVPVETRKHESEVWVQTGNGWGSVGSKARRFTTENTNTGTAITYSDDATNGATFTINERGIYSSTYCDSFNAAETMGITRNSSAATAILSVTDSDVLALATTAEAHYTSCVSFTMRLAIGDVIRAHRNGSGTTGTTAPEGQMFRIAKIAE